MSKYIQEYQDKCAQILLTFMEAVEEQNYVGGFASHILKIYRIDIDIDLEDKKKVSYDQEGIDIHGAIDSLEEAQDKLNKLIDMQVSRSEEGLGDQLDIAGDEWPSDEGF
jgi:hypothetical protein